MCAYLQECLVNTMYNIQYIIMILPFTTKKLNISKLKNQSWFKILMVVHFHTIIVTKSTYSNQFNSRIKLLIDYIILLKIYPI